MVRPEDLGDKVVLKGGQRVTESNAAALVILGASASSPLYLNSVYLTKIFNSAFVGGDEFNDS